MEIGGCDIIVDSEKCFLPILKKVVIKYWPHVVYEEDTLKSEHTEVFIYKDQMSKDAWDKDYGDDLAMIYYIYNEKDKQATFVIDDLKKNKFIVDDIIKQA